jgi:hypothetical protein
MNRPMTFVDLGVRARRLLAGPAATRGSTARTAIAVDAGGEIYVTNQGSGS